MNKIFSQIGLPDDGYDWLLTLVAVLSTFVFIVLIILFIKYAGRATALFIKESLSDPHGRGDIKYVIAGLITILAFIPMVWAGFVFNRWAPEGIFIAVGGLLLGLLGLGSVDFRSALQSGAAIIRANPPEEKIVKTNPPTENKPVATAIAEPDFILKK